MGIKAYFSNRIYKNTILDENVDAIGHALFVFNRAKQFAFSTATKEKRSGMKKRDKSLHLTVKNRFSLDDYYTNSAVQEAKAKEKSLDELKKLYMKNKEIQIKSIKNKIKKDKSKLTSLKKIKKTFRNGKPSFPKNSRIKKLGNYFVVQFKNKTDLYYHTYQLEHTYLDTEIKRRHTRIGFLNFKLNKYEDSLRSLNTKIPSVVFGSKKHFQAQYTVNTYIDNHKLWQKTWEENRYRKMVISGRKDSGCGNFVFNYDGTNKVLRFKTPKGVSVEVGNLYFPYGQEKVESRILAQTNCKNKKKYGKPVAWAIEDCGEYYIFKTMFDDESKAYVNHSKTDGAIGIDCNVDHFAVSTVNSNGQLLGSWSLKFNLKGKTSGQTTKIIEAEAIEIVNIATRTNKPIVVEKLNTTSSKLSNPYGNKKVNRMMSAFAYKKMLSAIKSRAEKEDIAVFEVNPAYTSQIGKMKYMKRLGISIHEAASFVIARRAMGFKEKLPPVLGTLLPEKIVGAHHWVHWKYISNALKGIHINSYYHSNFFNLDRFRSTNELFASGALTDLEIKGLLKLKNGKTAS
ncbi:RNA-guided endonuclease TnpB family protein [Virgibacillus necropolis]|uniref:Transposase n=1 Tax=Virgibacillus necropolis TaxID=163877 RepID=A0A221MFZ4_9BACI|nr:RNA-guided endonuclease TnpB family protein [Virgibacillus necropolis]ASN06577.1 transposase [Virgibacillus necropolis]